ncbi:conserved Plasmodium protein, unknown function [Plasmodium ovale curtisi]|uniref:Uncharacterized protein n=1 Tax=Plasmodium ovale curtisi TaxID=864141 RepID=A0A1A8WYL3_PLAOA|nr:conserved Plasmodium protein, unknown function [Plasmodium ovale curtisi]
MEKKKYSTSSSTFKEKLSSNKSYLDLSNYSKVNYDKQNSINNTNEICEFFTSITNNQKDISKKYEQLFSLIKKFGKEIKYLLSKNDEYNNMLVDTKEYIKRIKTKLSDSSCSEFENIEVELFEDRNNIDVIGRIVTYLFEEVGYYNKNSYECNKKIEDLKKSIGSKDEYTKLERKLTLKSEELKKEMIDNMSSLREQQDLKIKIKEDRNFYRKDIQNMNQKLLYVILKFILLHKKYKMKKLCFRFWLSIVKSKKEARSKIIFCFCKKQHHLLSFCLRKLKSNCLEKHLVDKITSLVGTNLYTSNSNNRNNNNYNSNIKGDYYSANNVTTDRKSTTFSNFARNNSKMKNSDIGSINYDHVHKNSKKRSESTIFYEKNNGTIRKSDVTSMYDVLDDNTSKKRDTSQFYVEDDIRNKENNVFEKNNSLYEHYNRGEPNYNIEKMYDKFLHQMKEKADQKNVDILHQTIKKLNNKINDIRITLDKQKRINERMSKNIPIEKLSSNYKNSSNEKISGTDYNNSIGNNDSLNILSERTLSEYLLNKNTSRNMSTNKNVNGRSVTRKKSDDFENRSEYSSRRKKSDSTSQKKAYDNIEKWNLNNNKYSKNNSLDTVCNDSNYHPYQQEFKNNARGNSRAKNCTANNTTNSNANKRVPSRTHNRGASSANNHGGNSGNNCKKYLIENSNDSSSASDIKLILRTGGGFRKLSEHDQKNYIEKLNYLNDNNLLGYETNLNIKIKGHPFIHNVPNNNQNACKKEKRHRSLSKFYNMH